MIYDDGSSAGNCYCDGSDDAPYTCDYHFENPEFPEVSDAYSHTPRHAEYDLEDAYGVGHYKAGVY